MRVFILKRLRVVPFWMLQLGFLHAADVEWREGGSAHHGKASCVRGGGLPDDQAPEKARTHHSLPASFARAMLATLCARPNLVHIARPNPVAGLVAPRKAVPRQEATYIGLPVSPAARRAVRFLIDAEQEQPTQPRIPKQKHMFMDAH